jgi:hypothetical protein
MWLRSLHRRRGNRDQGGFYPKLIATPVSSWNHWHGADFCVFFVDRESFYLKDGGQHDCCSGTEKHVDSILAGRGNVRRTNVRKGPLVNPRNKCAIVFDIRHNTSERLHYHLPHRLGTFGIQGHRLAILGT